MWIHTWTGQTTFSKGPAQTMHRVLSTPELLDAIFSQSEKSTLPAAARTVKAWSGLALDILWEDLPSLVPLFKLISGLHPAGIFDSDDEDFCYYSSVRETQLDFHGALGPKDCARFLAMGNRVKTLQHDDRGMKATNGSRIRIAPAVFTQIAFQRTTQLVPNLRSLEWHASRPESLSHLLLFLSPSLRDVSLVTLPQLANPAAISRFITFLSERAFPLQRISFGVPASADLIQTSLVEFITNTPSLRTIELPAYSSSNEILTALAALPTLEHIKQTYTNLPSLTVPITGTFEFHENQFQGLKTLWFDASLMDANILLNDPSRPPLLEDLGIWTCQRGILTMDALNDLLTTIALNYHKLKHFRINITRDFDAPPASYEILSCLFPCHDLRSLKIAYNHPFQLSYEQVVEMGTNWKKLVSLALCEDITGQRDPGSASTPITLLPAFGWNFPDLEDLSLHMDIKEYPLTSPARVPFPKLKTLNFGFTPIQSTHVNRVATFLSEILRPHVELRFGAANRLLEGAAFMFGDSEWEIYWLEVKELMAILWSHQARLKQKYDSELERKEKRIKELEEKLGNMEGLASCTRR